MSFWKFITSGIGQATSDLHRKVLYVTALVSQLAVSIFAGLTGWVTGGDMVWILASAAAAAFSVYLFGYIFFISRSQKSQ